MTDDFWEQAARRDPLWAILSDPIKRGRRWELREFFETGRREVSLLLYQLRQLGHFPRTSRALDFGCGVGRLTQALALTFREVIGVDVSPTMIELADQLNRNPESTRYVLNQSERLSQFRSEDFDFIYSDIVLQHVEPEAAESYIAEFVRLLRPSGVVVFQLPSHGRSALEETNRPVHMSPQHYRARLCLVESPPMRMRAKQATTAILDVRNDSPLEWDQGTCGVIRLGNHWRTATGEMIIQDDGRTQLPRVVQSGATVRVPVTIAAPANSGNFECEFDLVHEGVSWFGDLGSITARSSVTVISSEASEAGAVETIPTIPQDATEIRDIYSFLPPSDDVHIGSFPMHGVPRDTVISILERCGASMFFIEEEARAGPEWHSYRYFAKKLCKTSRR